MVLGIFLIPQLGLVKAIMSMGLINLSVGVSFGLLGRRRDSQPLIGAADDGSAVDSLAIYAVVALLARWMRSRPNAPMNGQYILGANEMLAAYGVGITMA